MKKIIGYSYIELLIALFLVGSVSISLLDQQGETFYRLNLSLKNYRQQLVMQNQKEVLAE